MSEEPDLRKSRKRDWPACETPIEILGSSEFGGTAHFTLEVRGRVHSTSQDYWDANWLRTYVVAKVPGFDASFGYELMQVGDLAAFHRELAAMSANLSGSAKLTTLEDFLEVSGTMDALGRIEWKVRLTYPSGGGSQLEFVIKADQSYLPKLVGQVQDVLVANPLIGNPNG